MTKIIQRVRQFRDSSPLSFRMLGYILLCSSVFTLGATGLQVYSDFRKDLSQVEQRLQLIETSYTSSLSNSLWSLDQKLLQVQMEGILNLPDIEHLHLSLYPDSTLELGAIPNDVATIQHTIKLSHQGEELYELGELTITASMAQIYASLRNKILLILTTQAFKTFLISVVILWIFQRLVTRHLSRMANYTRKLSLDGLHQALVLDRSQRSTDDDELQRVTDSINAMRLRLLRDIEQQQDSERRIRHLSEALEQCPTSILVCDRHWQVIYANKKFTQIRGASSNSLLGRHPQDILQVDLTAAAEEFSWQRITEQVEHAGVWQGEVLSHTHTGDKFWEQITVTPVRDDQGSISNFLLMGEDVSIRKRYEQQLLRQANYDVLTGLPNRMLALDRLKVALAQSGREQHIVGIMFLDLDNFKHINDTLGHDNGDALLIEASRRISSCLRGNSTVARLGGDEFLVILPSLAAAEDSEAVAQRILEAFSPPFSLGSQEVFVTTSIGIAIYPIDSDNSSILLQQADAAMYQAKNKGKSAFQRYLPEHNQQSSERLKIETLLRKAIENDELTLYYQPIVEAATGQLVGAEALIRWNSSQLGMVMPDKFIPLAEETGLIVSIGEWVLRTAVRDIALWQREQGLKLNIAVNVSPRQFRDPKFVHMVSSILEEFGLPPQHLELEITERLLLDGSIEIHDILHALDVMGVRLSVDDFGTGYSALSYLKTFPFDSLKIDRSFVKDVMTEKEDAALVTAIITMAHSLGLSVIAEGVEDAAQLHFLRLKGCDYAQGYFYSRPAPLEEFREWITHNRIAAAS